jgi:alpha-1,2-mannosyltransferase
MTSQAATRTVDFAPLFDARRMRDYPMMVLAIFLLAAIGLVWTSASLVDATGKPLGYDFITFWAASDLTLQGRPEAAFDHAQALAVQQTAVTGSEVVFFWHYPPTFQLLAAPLAFLPYLPSYLAFAALGYAAYLFALRPLVRQPRPLLLLAAFPAAVFCFYHGQNSTYSAALLGCAVWLSERKDRKALLAGVCIGLLAYKPQLGVLAPLAFAAAGQWRLFAVAAVTSLGFCAIATLVLGPGLWMVFASNFPFVKELVETGALPWAKMPSAWVFARMLGAPETAAYVLQGLVALTAAGVVAFVWRTCGMTRLSWAVLISATLMVPHYLFDYELTLLAIPCAILASDMAERGATRAEKLTLLAVVALCGFIAPLTSAAHVQVGFPMLAAILWLSARRALAAANARPAPSSAGEAAPGAQAA